MPSITDIVNAFLRHEPLTNKETQSDGIILVNRRLEIATWAGGKVLVLRRGANYDSFGLHGYIKGQATTVMALAETPNGQTRMNL